jgi:hypothetical protein
MKELQNGTLKYLIRICWNMLIILVATIMELLLLKKYPMTGLGRIFFIPFTILIIVWFMVIANQTAKKFNNLYIVIATYILMIILTIIVCIGLWTQDGGPTTWEQIFEEKKREHSD